MNDKEKVILAINKVIAELELAIDKNEPKVMLVSSIAQLSKFKNVFINVLNIVNSGILPPKQERNLGMAYIIVNQWPFDLEPGCLIIDAEQSYKDY